MFCYFYFWSFGDELRVGLDSFFFALTRAVFVYVRSGRGCASCVAFKRESAKDSLSISPWWCLELVLIIREVLGGIDLEGKKRKRENARFGFGSEECQKKF